LCFKIPALSTQPARKFPCFYRVVETRVFFSFPPINHLISYIILH
jgi:hypothetical protein